MLSHHPLVLCTPSTYIHTSTAARLTPLPKNTMRLPASFLSLLFVRAVLAQTTHVITVGGLREAAAPGGQPSPSFTYQPESINAAPGDVVQFNFLQLNHTITQSTFENPCVKAQNGFDSGFVVNQDGRPGLQFSVRINDTNPICKSGFWLWFLISCSLCWSENVSSC